MNIPQYVQGKAINDNGFFESYWQLFFDQLITQLQLTFGNGGYVLPEQTTDQINKLAANNINNKYILVINSDNGTLNLISGNTVNLVNTTAI